MRVLFKLKKLLIFIFFVSILFLFGCQEKSYSIKFFNQNKEIYLEIEVKLISEIEYPSLPEILLEDGYYEFIGWDSDNDSLPDQIDTLNKNYEVYPIYQKSLTNFLIKYNDTSKDYELKVTENNSFTLNIPDSDLYFFGYVDDNNNFITDENGVKLPNVKINTDLTLTPKFLQVNEIINLFEIPKSVVDGELLNEITKAIEEERVEYLSENTFIYDFNKYEIVVSTTANNNVFHNFTTVEKNTTYYFKYEPIEIKVLKADYENNDFSIVTNEIVGIEDFSLFNKYGILSFTNNLGVKPIENLWIENSLALFADIKTNSYAGAIVIDGVPSTLVTTNDAPNPDLIDNKKQQISDYFIATSDISVNYEYGSAFCISYITGELYTPTNHSSLVLGYDCYGEEISVDLTGTSVYGQLCVYNFSLKNLTEDEVI